MTPAIELTDLAFTYPDGHEALRGVSLRVDPGERIAVLGPNGSGKTTLVMHLNGILRPTSGSVVIDGLDATGPNLGDIRRRVGIVFQDPDDQLFMPTVRQDVAFGPANLGVAGDDLDRLVADALETVGMSGSADRAPHHLSFGQRRRVALATVLSMDPTVLVFDEPSANLDPFARRELADVITALGQTTVVVTHDLLYAAELCERSVIIDGGSIVADGPTRSLLTAERTALNLISRMSGVATHTRKWADALAGTKATVLDTRKTTPGLRALEKYAVRAGGGTNKRMGLYDVAMIKDNHKLAAGGITAAYRLVRAAFPDVPVQVEVTTLAEAREAVEAGAGFLLCDNMSPGLLREVAGAVGDRAELEATGNLTLDTVAAYAATGVDYLSVGGLTHSSPILDIAMDLRPR